MQRICLLFVVTPDQMVIANFLYTFRNTELIFFLHLNVIRLIKYIAKQIYLPRSDVLR